MKSKVWIEEKPKKMKRKKKKRDQTVFSHPN
jgi:hypothetical protein